MILGGNTEFGLVIDSAGADGTRPVAASMGASVTPGNNTYGTYVQLLAGASVTDDVYGILINCNNIGANTTARDTLATIGLDWSGGTSYTDWITDLIVSCAISYSQTAGFGGGVNYFFPLFIKAGTSIAIKTTQNNATPAAHGAFVRLFCKPSNPAAWRTGSRVISYGVTSASSSGTAITAGTTSDGTYVLLGTVAANDSPWFWQVGLGLNNTAVSGGQALHLDLAIGDGTNFKQPIQNQIIGMSTNETLAWGVAPGGWARAKAGDGVYARAQGASTSQAGTSAAAYGVM